MKYVSSLEVGSFHFKRFPCQIAHVHFQVFQTYKIKLLEMNIHINVSLCINFYFL